LTEGSFTIGSSLSAASGASRSKNNGTSWEAVFDKFGITLSIGVISIAPSDRNVVWVGIAAIESSSMPPTDAQQRSLAASVAEFTEIAAKVNEIISNQLPALLAKAGSTSTPVIARVQAPN
jgi:hypothetical protein